MPDGDTPPPPVPESRRGRQEADAALPGLDRPDRRGARRRLGRGRRGSSSEGRTITIVFAVGRGPRGRQDQDPLQRRRRRHARRRSASRTTTSASSPPRRWRRRPRTSSSRTRSSGSSAPRISGANVTGLGTLISGAYIGMEIGTSKKRKREFVALDTPPVVAGDVPGRFFVLKTPRPGLARRRHADLLPAPRGRRGRVVRARRRRHGAHASRSFVKRPTTSTSPPTRASGTRAGSTCR